MPDDVIWVIVHTGKKSLLLRSLCVFHIRLDKWHVKQDNTHPITGNARPGWECSKGENSKTTTRSTQQRDWIQTWVATSPSGKMAYLSLQSDILAKSKWFRQSQSGSQKVLHLEQISFAFRLSSFLSWQCLRFSLWVLRIVTIICNYWVKGLSL